MPPFMNEIVVQSQVGFTSNLMNTIQLSKARFSDWADSEKAKIDEETEAYNKKLAYEQNAIDSLNSNLVRLQFERGLNVRPEGESSEEHKENLANRKIALEKEQGNLEFDLSKLKSEYAIRETRVQGRCSSIFVRIRFLIAAT